MYKYRDKITDNWIDNPVSKSQIHELLRKGTLTPYDFVKKEIQNENYQEAEMILKLKNQEGDTEFEKADQLWASLRAIRLQFEKLWKGQLDEIMTIISSGIQVTENINIVKGSEPHLKKFRTNFNEEDLLNAIQELWQNPDDPSTSNDFTGLVNNEIKRRKRENDPRTFIIGAAANEPQSRIQQIYNFLNIERGFNNTTLGEENGVYLFTRGDEVTYVGQTTLQTFKTRITQHSNVAMPFINDFTKIEFYTVNRSVGIASQRIAEFEKLMLFKHKPIYNVELSIADSIKIALEIIKCEINELKRTG